RSDFSHAARVMATLTTTSGSLLFTRLHGQDRFYFQPLTGTTTYRLYRIVDSNNYTTSLTYDPTTNRLSTVTDPATRTLTFQYYAGGLLQSVTDTAGGR